MIVSHAPTELAQSEVPSCCWRRRHFSDVSAQALAQAPGRLELTAKLSGALEAAILLYLVGQTLFPYSVGAANSTS